MRNEMFSEPLAGSMNRASSSLSVVVSAILSTHTWLGGLVFKAHRLWYHSTLGSRVVKKKNKVGRGDRPGSERAIAPDTHLAHLSDTVYSSISFRKSAPP